MKRFVCVALSLVVVAAVGCTSAMAQRTAPASNYKKVSTLVSLPDFIPGLGTLYVDPATPTELVIPCSNTRARRTRSSSSSSFESRTLTFAGKRRSRHA